MAGGGGFSENLDYKSTTGPDRFYDGFSTRKLMYSITSLNISSGISLYDFPNFFFTQIATCAYGFLPLGWCLEGGSFPTNIPPASCIYDQISLEFASFTPSISLGTFVILQTTMLAGSASILYQTIVLELTPRVPGQASPSQYSLD